VVLVGYKRKEKKRRGGVVMNEIGEY